MFDIRQLFAAPPFRRPVLDAFDHAAAPLETGDAAGALGLLDAALTCEAAAARRAFGHNKRGVALVMLGRRDDAVAAFCAALAEVEPFAPALVNIGNLLLEDGDVADAIEQYKAAAAADEGYTGAYRGLAIALRRAGRASEAGRYLKKALRLETRRRS